jgi:hypothetical protein
VLDRKDPVFKHITSTAKVEKPWGSFEQYTHPLPSIVKIITVAPGGVFRKEYGTAKDSGETVVLGDHAA